jgi:hypothetical protein
MLHEGESTEALCCEVPTVQRPQVQLSVAAASCTAADNQALALEVWRQLTQGTLPADAALIVAEVASCTQGKVSGMMRCCLCTVSVTSCTCQQQTAAKQGMLQFKWIQEPLVLQPTQPLFKNALLVPSSAASELAWLQRT